MSDQRLEAAVSFATSTVTRVLRSPAFLHSRERSGAIAESPSELRALADSVETLDHANAALAVVADRVVAAVRFLRARADGLDAAAAAPNPATLTERTIRLVPHRVPVSPLGSDCSSRVFTTW